MWRELLAHRLNALETGGVPGVAELLEGLRREGAR
jgi:hypothetical protein